MNKKTKIALITALACVIAAVAVWQTYSYLQRRHQIDVQRQDIQKRVAEGTEAVSEMVELETHQSNITFGELFERNDDRVKKLSDAIIPIAISSLPDEEKNALKAYLKGLQEVLRSQTACYRKQLAVSTDLEISKTAEKDYADSAADGYNQFERKRAQDSLAEAQKALEEFKMAARTFVNELRSFRVELNKARPILKDYDLVDDNLLASAIKKDW
jgi:hypothetical protein